MVSSILDAKITGFATELPFTATTDVQACKDLYEANRDRIYSLAFWATYNEITAEELSVRVFSRACTKNNSTEETVDSLLIAELRDLMPVGLLTLDLQSVTSSIANARRNVKRELLERAVVQVPVTERLIFLMHDVEGYDHARISRTIGVTEEESQHGLHQARLHLRNLLATMK